MPGDIVFLESGDKIPADVRLVEVKNLRTEEAALTGELVPSDKSTAPVSAKATVGDRACMAYSGTLVVSGRATGIVVGTGSDTELGRINQMLAGVSALETPLLLQIKKFGYAITVIILIVSAITFAYGRLVQNIPFIDMFQAVTGIAVSMIPEGLPALITITLAIGVQRMAGRNAIVRRLPAVETLGSVARICSDKTGTLTLMEMMVVSTVTASETVEVTGDGYASEGEVLKDGAPVGKEPDARASGPRLRALQRRGAAQRGRRLEGRGRSDRGRALSVRRQARARPAKEQAAYPRIDVIPFESEHRFMATLHKTPEGGEVLLVKGAPEVDPRPLRPAGGRIGRAAAARSRAFRARPPTLSPRKASACWRWRGCPIRASRPGAWVRPICRRPSCCSVLSGSSIRRARKRSRRSRNAMPAASG